MRRVGAFNLTNFPPDLLATGRGCYVGDVVIPTVFLLFLRVKRLWAPAFLKEMMFSTVGFRFIILKFLLLVLTASPHARFHQGTGL